MHTGDGWLAEIQRDHQGLWVAIKNGEVIDARETPYELHASLHDHGIANATIVRCPRMGEPELVGLG